MKHNARKLIDIMSWAIGVAMMVTPFVAVGATPIATYDMSQGFSISNNPAGVWSYGWKSNFNGAFTKYAYYKRVLDPVSPPGAYVDIWARFANSQSMVVHNGTEYTARTGDGCSYAPGTTLLCPGVNNMDDHYAVVRFQVPTTGEYLVGCAAENANAVSAESDIDFHVLKNGEEVFGEYIPAATGGIPNRREYTNTFSLNAGDTIEFLGGRGANGDFTYSNTKVWATLSLLSSEPVPPSIVGQPAGRSVLAGANVAFSVSANGSLPMGYQWLFDGTAIDGATSSTLALNNVQAAQAGNYSVVVSNEFGTVESSTAVLTVTPALEVYNISQQFSISNNPAGVWAYGWKSNFSGNFNAYAYYKRVLDPMSPPGAYVDIWARFANDQSAVVHNGTEFTARSGNGCSFAPGTTVLCPGVNERDDNYAAVRFQAQVGGQYLLVCAAENANAVSSYSDTDFHVLRNGEEMLGADLPAATGGVSNRREYTNTVSLNAGDTIEFLGGRGANNDFHYSNTKLWATLALLSCDPVPPSIVTQPVNRSVLAGANATFFVQASGAPTLSYQWKFNETDIEGATNSSLALSNVQAEQAGNYSVVIRNSYGELTSSVVSLTVTPTLAIYDLSSDFSGNSNPNGVWSYGASASVGGAFSIFCLHGIVYNDNGVPIQYWQLNPQVEPTINHNASTNTGVSFGGRTVYPPGEVILFPGTDGQANGFGVVRFTAPLGQSGTYLIQTSAKHYLNSMSVGDTDYHVVRNGVEEFGQFLPAGGSTSYESTVTLAGGETVDFVVGRGADGSGNYSGLKIKATVALLTVQPVPPTILTQPQGQSVFAGANVAFNVRVSASPPIAYQWLLNGSEIDGATGSSLTLNNVQAAQAGSYSVRVTNNNGAVESIGAVLSITSAINVADLSKEFSTSANPAGVWSYGWKSNFSGNFNLYAFYKRVLDPVSPAGAFVDIWARFANDQSAVVHNGTEFTARSGDGGVFPPGTTLLCPGVNGRDDTYAAVRFQAQVGGQYLLVCAAENGNAVSAMSDSDFHVLKNGEELFGAEIPAATSGVANRREYTNSLSLNAGDTIEFLGGRGANGDFHYSNTKLWAQIALIESEPVAPSITMQPVSQSVLAGANVTYAVQANGAPPLSYQWQFNGADIEGATNSTLVLPGVQTAQAGAYTVRVSNAYGSVDSASTSLEVRAALAVYDIANDYSPSNNPAGVWTYGWKSTFAGEFNQYTFSRRQFVPSTPAGGFIDFWARYANDQSCVWHNASSTTVYAAGTQGIYPPGTVIMAPGVNGREDNYAVIRFTAPAAGTYFVCAALQNLYHGSISGDTDFHLVKNGTELFGQSVPADNGAEYHTGGFTNSLGLAEGETVEFLCGRGADGDFTGSGLVIKATIGLLTTEPVPPSITVQPVGQTVLVGANVTLSVGVSGAPPFTYQWQRNGADLANATNASLVLQDVQTADAGSYSVQVNNPYGAVLSSYAELPVTEPPVGAPVITQQPANQTVTNGGRAIFTVAATGTGPLSYQWRFNGAEIPAATSNTLILVNVQTSQAGRYSVRVSNATGFTDSTEALLNVEVGNLINPGTIFFQNRYVGGVSSAPISFAGEGPAPAGRINGTNAIQDGEFTWGGVNARAGLYVGPAGSGEEALTLIAPIADFRYGASAGYLNVGTLAMRMVPDIPAGSPAVAQIRVWDTGTSNVNSFEDAVAIAKSRAVYLGKSALIEISALGGGSPPIVPAELLGLTAFSAVYSGAGSTTFTNAILLQVAQPAPRQSVTLAMRLPSVPGGSVHLEFLGTMGQVYYIQASSDMKTWVTIGTRTTIMDGTVAFDDTDAATAGNRFYRIATP